MATSAQAEKRNENEERSEDQGPRLAKSGTPFYGLSREDLLREAEALYEERLLPRSREAHPKEFEDGYLFAPSLDFDISEALEIEVPEGAGSGAKAKRFEAGTPAEEIYEYIEVELGVSVVSLMYPDRFEGEKLSEEVYTPEPLPGSHKTVKYHVLTSYQRLDNRMPEEEAVGFFVMQHMHYTGSLSDVLTEAERGMIYGKLADGFGAPPPEYDFSHVRDSSYPALFQMAAKIEELHYPPRSPKREEIATLDERHKLALETLGSEEGRRYAVFSL